MSFSTSARGKKIKFAGTVTVLGLLSGFILWSGTGQGRRTVALTKGGDAKLIAVNPLPEMDGEMCQMVPASASASLSMMAQQPQAPPDRAPDPFATGKRPPVRAIQDPNPVYSAIALDLTNDEVVTLDENTYSIMVYNRTENTPPTARMSEPKRLIQGPSTNLDLNCGLYVDPGNGEVYSINNDTLQMMTVFDRSAKGDVKPTRVLRQPGSLYGIAVDEGKKEMYLVSQNGTIYIYDKLAKDHDQPKRFIQGNKTKLGNSHGIALDTKNRVMYVGDFGSRRQSESPEESDIPWGDGRRRGRGGRVIAGSGEFDHASISTFPMDAMGDVAPLRVIKGPKTHLNWPTAMAFDEQNNEIYVANDTGHSVTVYKADAHGDVAPIRMISGPKTLIKNPSGIAYDSKHQEIWVSNFSSHSATVFPRTANGDLAPARLIRSAPLEAPAPVLSNPHVVLYNGNRDELIVAT